MNDLLTKYDTWLEDSGPAALVIREHLMSVEGRDGVVFPPTFAGEQTHFEDRFPGGYNIDRFPDGSSVCTIDTVASQANRVEPIFASARYNHLVPQVIIRAGAKNLNLLIDAGHRAGDALVRCSTLANVVDEAVRKLLAGDAGALAKCAPTSLVFGMWDSRATGAKVPRLITSTIRALNVRKLRRHGLYVPATAYVEDGLLPEPTGKDNYAERGFKHQPITRQPDPKKPDPTHGGIIADGGIRRDATLNLAALRLLKAGDDEAKTLTLRRYILGLSLVAFTHPSAFVGYLRQGCTLVLDPDAKPSPREFSRVYPDGRREFENLTHDEACKYADAVAKDFEVGESTTVEFDKNAAKNDVAKAK